LNQGPAVITKLGGIRLDFFQDNGAQGLIRLEQLAQASGFLVAAVELFLKFETFSISI
jgi:hypothetical protein